MASYAVSIGHFSARSLAAAMSRTVIRRELVPPYSDLSTGFWAGESCVMVTAPVRHLEAP